MKSLFKLIAFAICLTLIFSLASCMDLGAGEDEEAFKKYFSEVFVLSGSGLQKYSMAQFVADVDMDSIDISTVVPYEEYGYICFRVENGYTLSFSEFAFFARTESTEGTLDIEFYITDKMPTSIKDSGGNDVEVSPPDEEIGEEGGSETGGEQPESGEQTEGGENDAADDEVREDDLFLPDKLIESIKVFKNTLNDCVDNNKSLF